MAFRKHKLATGPISCSGGHAAEKPRALTRKQIGKLREKFDRDGINDIRVGECRGVSKGVDVCRPSKTRYYVGCKRAGSTRAMRRADAARGIRYI